MSVASPVTPPLTPAARTAPAPQTSRLGLLFAVLLVTGASSLALTVVSFAKPIGAGDTLPDYASIASMRGYVWAFFFIAAVQLIVGMSAAALAVWILVPARGARWATVGGSLVWLGAAIYGVGVGGWAALYYFGSDPSVPGPTTAARLIDHVNDDTVRMLAVPIGGALLVTLGSLLLAVALWRARSVPRWVPIASAVTGVATIVIPTGSIGGVVSEAASSVTAVAIGWYVWRRA
jgi:hypothetical protein